MSGFYVLDVPEFAPLVVAAGNLARCRVHAPRAGYIFVEFDSQIEIARSDTGLGEAVWFGCLTGGLEGKILSFDGVSIKLAPTGAPSPSLLGSTD